MFSGIIEELGQIKKIFQNGTIASFEIQADKVLEDTKAGDSIAVNGACLTVVKKTLKCLIVEVMPETFKITNLGSLRVSDKVNLERSLKIGDRLSGHFVYGHIDCVGIIRQKKHSAGNLCFAVALPAMFLEYILPKGSVAVDGISLTIMAKGAGAFSVYVIPHTLKNTTLGFKGPSDKVNIECDILTKN